jgi:hypothetical protein
MRQPTRASATATKMMPCWEKHTSLLPEEPSQFTALVVLLGFSVLSVDETLDRGLRLIEPPKLRVRDTWKLVNLSPSKRPNTRLEEAGNRLLKYVKGARENNELSIHAATNINAEGDEKIVIKFAI